MCTNKSIAGETCQTSGDCFNSGACVNGTCCAFSYYEATNSMYNQYSYSNCTACNSLNKGQCGACAPGYQLEYQYPSSMYGAGSVGSGNMVCRQVCDPLTEYRRSWSDALCTKKLTPGISCSTSDTCASGLCGGLSWNMFSGGSGSSYCCDAAAAAANCSKGCEPMSGQCTTKPGPGEKCQSRADCFGGVACLGGAVRV